MLNKFLYHHNSKQFNGYITKKLLHQSSQDIQQTYKILFSINTLNYSKYKLSNKSTQGFCQKKSNPIKLVYQSFIKDNGYQADQQQDQIIEYLCELDINLKQKNQPKGLYIYGSTGCGKTMMMDLFYQNCSIPINQKFRTHFHYFMLDIHERLHKLRSNHQYKQISDPFKHVAQQIIQQKGHLMCLDEFQVTDVADAMILKRLLSAIFESNGVLIATSNRSPDDLYYGGLNRDIFLPFIPYIKSKCHILNIQSNDYRMLSLISENIYFYPQNQENYQKILHIWKVFSYKLQEISITIPVMMGRNLSIAKACIISQNELKAICWIDFQDFCKKELGSADYIAIAKNCPVVILTGIPQFTQVEDRNEMRRFITLIDILYDNHIYLVCCADKPPIELFKKIDIEDNSTAQLYKHAIKTASQSYVSEKGGASGRQHTMIGNTEWQATGILGANLYDLQPRLKEDEQFAFGRTVSRLFEMQSEEYLKKAFQNYKQIVQKNIQSNL